MTAEWSGAVATIERVRDEPARAVRHRYVPSPATTYALAVYLATRLAVFVGFFVAKFQANWLPTKAFLTRWDAFWYLTIAQHGYPTTLHPQLLGVHDKYSQWGFYPGYPLVVRGVHDVTRLGFLPAGYVVAGVFGLTAVRAMYALGEEAAGVGAATALLFAAWPGSVVLSMPYSEGLYVTAAASALVLALRRRWVWAGVAGFVAAASRPSGVVLVAALLVAAAVAIARERDWRSLAAPVLTACGMGTFVLYGWARTGDPLIWLRAEGLWHQRFDFGRHMFLLWHASVVHPTPPHVSETVLEIGGCVVVLAMLALAIRGFWRRFPPALLAYTLVAIVMTVGYGTIGARPRMVLVILPGFVLLAAALRRWRRAGELLAVTFAGTIALVASLYVGPTHILP